MGDCPIRNPFVFLLTSFCAHQIRQWKHIFLFCLVETHTGERTGANPALYSTHRFHLKGHHKPSVRAGTDGMLRSLGKRRTLFFFSI